MAPLRSLLPSRYSPARRHSWWVTLPSDCSSTPRMSSHVPSSLPRRPPHRHLPRRIEEDRPGPRPGCRARRSRPARTHRIGPQQAQIPDCEINPSFFSSLYGVPFRPENSYARSVRKHAKQPRPQLLEAARKRCVPRSCVGRHAWGFFSHRVPSPHIRAGWRTPGEPPGRAPSDLEISDPLIYCLISLIRLDIHPVGAESMLRAIRNRTGNARGNFVLSPLESVFTSCHAIPDLTKSFRMNVYVM